MVFPNQFSDVNNLKKNVCQEKSFGIPKKIGLGLQTYKHQAKILCQTGFSGGRGLQPRPAKRLKTPSG